MRLGRKVPYFSREKTTLQFLNNPDLHGTHSVVSAVCVEAALDAEINVT